MHDVILEPLLAGLSSGLFCCMSCYPVMAPVFAAEPRNGRNTVRTWLQFLLGRLAGYLLFGAAIGWLGERYDTAGLTALAAIVMVAMGGLLISYALGFWKPAWSFCAAGTPRAALAPLTLGLLTGFNACPPFLLSLAYVFALHSTWKGLVYFLVFFCATTVYMLPLLAVGLLGRMAEFRLAARLSALAVGLLFMVYGILKM